MVRDCCRGGRCCNGCPNVTGSKSRSVTLDDASPQIATLGAIAEQPQITKTRWGRKNKDRKSIDYNHIEPEAGIGQSHIELGSGLISSPSSIDSKGRTSFHHACDRGLLANVEEMIRLGAHFDTADLDGMLPQHFAAKRGHADILEVLFKNGAKVNALMAAGYKHEHNDACIHLATRAGHASVIRVLHKYGANMNLTNGEGKTALTIACEKKKPGLAEVLLECGADPDYHETGRWCPIHISAKIDDAVTATILLRFHANPVIPAKNGWLPMHVACAHGSLDALKTITRAISQQGLDMDCSVSLKQSPSDRGLYPLHLACRSGSLPTVRYVYEHGGSVDLNRRDRLFWTPMHYAAEGGYVDIGRFLLECRENPDRSDDEGLTPLHKASENGHEGMVKLLLSCPSINVNSCFKAHFTPLHFAAQNGHTSIARCLLDAGALPSAGSEVHWTPIDAARKYGHSDIVSLLSSAGATLSSK